MGLSIEYIPGLHTTAFKCMIILQSIIVSEKIIFINLYNTMHLQRLN